MRRVLATLLTAATTMVLSCTEQTNHRPPQVSPQTSAPSSGGEDAHPTSPANSLELPIASIGTEAPYSNIRPEDYVGPETCGKCHRENYLSWKNHPHSRMNALASDETVVGDFSGTSLSYVDGQVEFDKQNGAFVVRYMQREKPTRTFQVTRTIGWRYRQDYVAIETEGPEPPGDPIYTTEARLLFGYQLNLRRWLPRSYYFRGLSGSEYLADGSLRHDPFIPRRQSFTRRCVFCHNTYPYDVRLYLGNTGFELPNHETIGQLIADDPRSVERDLYDLSPEGARAGVSRVVHLASPEGKPELPTQELVTVGISCESCHFGGREHVQRGREMRFVPTHPLLAEWMPDHKNARKSPRVVNAICRQCHVSRGQVWPDKSCRMNSMESIEQDSGACTTELRCTHCHNPHVRGPDAGGPDHEEHLAACVACHENFASQDAARAHSHHAPDQASCLDCHMPRIVKGLSIGVVNRTHRISAPTDPRIIPLGMPNACNLCHLDKSLTWTQRSLEEGWGKRIALAPNLTSDLQKGIEGPVGPAWLAFKPTRMVAADAYGRSPLGKKRLPNLIKLLDEPVPYTRASLLVSVERILGRKLTDNEYSLTGSPERRRQQVQRLLTRYGRKVEYDQAIAEFTQVIRLDRTDAKAYYDRGRAYVKKGEYDKAIADFTEVIRLDSRMAVAYANRGAAYGEKGEYDRAIADCTEAIRLDPIDAKAYVNRGVAYAGKGEYDEVIVDLSEAIRLDPSDAKAYYNRGVAHVGRGEYDQAIADFTEVIRLDSSIAVAYANRGVAHDGNGEYDQAIADYTAAIRLDPTYASGYNSVAWLLATCPEARYRDGRKAVENAIRACELSKWKHCHCLGTLAAAYAELGEFDKAIKWQTTAIELATAGYDKSAAQSRVKLYKAGKPYREEPEP